MYSKPHISVVIPVYNESEGIDELYRRATTAIASFTDSFEVICVDDGSHDTSLSQLINYHKKDARFKVISLSRNFGHQSAVLAGKPNCFSENAEPYLRWLFLALLIHQILI